MMKLASPVMGAWGADKDCFIMTVPAELNDEYKKALLAWAHLQPAAFMQTVDKARSKKTNGRAGGARPRKVAKPDDAGDADAADEAAA